MCSHYFPPTFEIYHVPQSLGAVKDDGQYYNGFNLIDEGKNGSKVGIKEDGSPTIAACDEGLYVCT